MFKLYITLCVRLSGWLAGNDGRAVEVEVEVETGDDGWDGLNSCSGCNVLLCSIIKSVSLGLALQCQVGVRHSVDGPFPFLVLLKRKSSNGGKTPIRGKYSMINTSTILFNGDIQFMSEQRGWMGSQRESEDINLILDPLISLKMH